VLSAGKAESFREEYFDKLDADLLATQSFKPQADHLKGKWASITHPTQTISRLDTGLAEETLRIVGQQSVQCPDGFEVHPRLLKHHIQPRLDRLRSGQGLDWATAEALALGSLLLEGHNVRISGQDVGRGTFSQRHVILVDQQTEKNVIPLNGLKSDNGSLSSGFIEVANSSLSEFAVLGFEYGMSLESPNTLNIWEAQFGDFFNGAQVIIDTYINSGEQKWLRQSGLVMLLPHGYDGAGPEHSSCRVERFLQVKGIFMLSPF
jgi:probable 2-oxoglutarate dehydrogenase E1 component DHKTD1